MNDSLNKYILEGQAMEDLMNRQDDAFALNESGEETPAPVASYHDPYAMRKFLVEAILGECYPGTPTSIIQGSRANPNPKVEKTRALLSVVQDMVWKMNDSSYADPDVCKAVQDACGPLIKTMVQKLYNIWCIDDTDRAPENKPTTEPAKEIPTTVDPAGVTALPAALSPTLELSFTQGESIVSPQDKEYIIEEVGAAQLKLKEKKTGAKATVSIEIAKKWKK